MDHPTHDDRGVWPAYEELLERSRLQFAQLRELPLYGRKLWERARPRSVYMCAWLAGSRIAERLRGLCLHTGQYHDAFQLFASLWSFLQGNR